MTRFSPAMNATTPASDPSPDETVLAMDNIPLALPIASVGSRGLAASLDYTIASAIGIAWVFACALLGARLESLFGMGWTFAIMIAGVFVLQYGYFAAIEIATGGRSVGKWALDLRVVSRHGGKASVVQLLVRNLVRLLDALVGVWFMLLDPLSRRIGDRLAGTLVVHTRAQEQEIIVGRIPAGWGPRQVSVVESLLRRADGMDPVRARALARDLLDLLERDDPTLMAEVPADPDPVVRLRRAVQVG